MEFKKLLDYHDGSMRAVVSAVIHEQGLLPQFYWPIEMLNAEMATAEAVGVFLEEILVGFVLYRILPGAWEVSLVATHPRFRRRGLMSALLKYLINSRENGVAIWLEVHQENKKAQALYQKLGFKLAGTRPRYYKDGATALLYTFE